MSLSGKSGSFGGLAEAILAGDREGALGSAQAALDSSSPVQEIVLGGVLKAWSDFVDWYRREPAEAMKKWFDCYNTTYLVLKLLWSRVPDPVDPPFSVSVATIRGEGHVLARDTISLLLVSRGVRVYRPRKGIIPEDLAESLADPSLKYLILSCCQDETRGPLIDLIKRAKAARPGLQVITGGRIAGDLGEDLTLPDPASLLRFIEENRCARPRNP